MNLPFEIKVETPHAAFDISERGDPINVIFVGTSFLWGPLRILNSQRILGRTELYYYFNSSFRYENDKIEPVYEPTLAANDFPKTLANVDFIILEINEESLEDHHVLTFLKAIEALDERQFTVNRPLSKTGQ